METNREVIVEPGRAGVVELAAGDLLDIVDLEGSQVGDLVAYRPDRLDEYFTPAHTCACLLKMKPEVGDEVFSNHRTPLLRVLSDDVGNHDMTLACCDTERYKRDFGVDEHESCFEALRTALEDFGSSWEIRGDLTWNVFMNNSFEGGRVQTHEPPQRAGSTMRLEALVDLVVAMAACPQDLTPCNGFSPSPMALRVLGSSDR